MPPKKKGPFMCFISHIQNDEANRRRSLPELIAEYGEVWKAMSAEERRPFAENTSNALNAARKILTNIRTDAMREEEQEMEEQLFREYLENLTEKVVGLGTIEELIDRSFYICSFNVMCRIQNGAKWLANEIGLVEYSIRSGIKNYYHEFIDPGDVPIGYARMAKEHSESTHQIPWVNFVHARGNKKDLDGGRDLEGRRQEFENMVLEICQMLEKTKIGPFSNKDPMIIFCKGEQESQVRGCLKFLCEESEELSDVYQQIEILDISSLLAHLSYRIDKPRPLAVCDGDLNRSSFDYSPNTNCNFHEELDCRYCALGVAKRLAYLMADILCDLYDIKPIPNRHLPQAENSFQVEEFFANERRFNFNPAKNKEVTSNDHQENDHQDNSIRPPCRLPQMRSEPRRENRLPAGGIGRGIRRN